MSPDVALSVGTTIKMKSMTKLIRATCTVIVVAIVATGCAESQRPQATGKGNIRGINAIVSAPPVAFLVEERAQGLLGFKDGLGSRFDDLPYKLNFDVRFVGDDENTRLATQAIDVVANTEYILSLTGTLAAPAITVWQQPERDWEGNETSFEASFGHLTDSVGTVDVYYDAPGIAPAAGNARGSIAKDGFIPAAEFPAGAYQLILTAANDPATIIYTSPTTTPGGALSLTYTFFDADPSITGPLSVRLMPSAGTSVELPDLNSPPTYRTYHGAFGTGNYDAYINADLTTAIAADVAFSQISGDTDAVVGDNIITFTAAGNAGSTLLQSTTAALAGARHSMFLAGPPGSLTSMSMVDDRRPEQTIGKFRLVHSAANTGAVDIYVTAPGIDIANVLPNLARISQFTSTDYARLNAGTYEARITPAADKTVIGGPLTLDFATDGIADLALLDTADPNVFTLAEWGN